MNPKVIAALFVLFVALTVGAVSYHQFKPATTAAPLVVPTNTSVSTSNTPPQNGLSNHSNETILSAPSNSSPSSDINALPALYSKYQWNASTEDYPDILNAPWPPFKSVSLHGTLYSVINTDSSVSQYQKDANSSNGDEPMGFYGGDGAVLDYYDKALRDLGYDSSGLAFDSKWNIEDTDIDSSTYWVSLPGADGPSGTMRGYVKHVGDKIRLAVISSTLKTNEIFFSDVFTSQELLSKFK
jgi:hypothetical protein